MTLYWDVQGEVSGSLPSTISPNWLRSISREAIAAQAFTLPPQGHNTTTTMSEVSAQSYEQMENPQHYFEEVSAGTNPMTRATPAYAPYTSTAGYRDLGGSAPYMDPTLLKRPARKQVLLCSPSPHLNTTYFYNIQIISTALRSTI